MSFDVAIDTFHGPLDLLLFLVKRNEVDVLDVNLSQLTDQFLDTIRAMPAIDVELAGDFLVMAATLMEIKSRALLPADAAAADDAGPDPRRELVKQLIEYRKFKDAADALAKLGEAHAARLPRQPVPEPAAAGGPVVRQVELWDLVAAFARLMREARALEPTTLTADDTPQEVYENLVRSRVSAGGRVLFRDVFDPPHTKARLIGLFLAVLELIKARAIGLEQPEAFGEIWLLAA